MFQVIKSATGGAIIATLDSEHANKADAKARTMDIMFDFHGTTTFRTEFSPEDGDVNIFAYGPNGSVVINIVEVK